MRFSLSLLNPASTLPRLSRDLPAIHGIYRVFPEDFIVNEEATYLPVGSGSHLFLLVEKRGLTTPIAIEKLANALGVRARDAGFAGMKDRHAITTQWLSFEGADREQALALELPGIRVIEAAYHERKLKTGHLRGNRFEIRVREVRSEDRPLIEEILERIRREGLPNYFGAQRFGRGDNVAHARAFLRGEVRPPSKPYQRRLLVSALQSELFNTYLAERVLEGRLGIIEAGELVKKIDTGGIFTAEDVEEVQARADRFEVHPTGPIFGPKMSWPEGAPREREEQVLRGLDLEEEALERMGKLGAGTRRVVRILPKDLEAEFSDDVLTLRFRLPKGAYATNLLEEIFKEGIAEQKNPARE